MPDHVPVADDLLDAIPAVVWEADAGLHIRFVSRHAERLLGYPVSEWTREPSFWRGVIHPDDRGWVVAMAERAVGRGEGYGGGYRMVAADGRTVWVREQVEPVVADGRVTGLRGLILDAGDRQWLEEQLLQSRKMEIVGRLVAGVAHDFNNLLMALGGYADLLLLELGSDSPGRGSVDEIRSVVQRGAGLVRQILTFSRKQAVAPRMVDLNLVVGDMVRMLRRLIGESIELCTSLEPGLGEIRADVGQVEQVVMNLAVNARDAMPAGGRLTIATARVDSRRDDDGRPEAGPWAMLMVSDSGSGIPPDVLSRIFEPFFTTKGEGRGTGLGLAIVKNVVTECGGRIRVDSRPGSGTTFQLFFPVVTGEAGTPVSEGAASPGPDGTETVLVVEDEESVRRLLAESLRRCGYTVLEARDGDEALGLCEGHAIPIHVMIADLVLPGLRATEVARRVSRLHPEVRFLFVSGYAEADVNLAPADGAVQAFLAKPFSVEELARRVRALLDD